MTDSILEEVLERYEEAQSAWDQNIAQGDEDERFAALGEQWPETIRTQRQKEGRPCLTINHMPKFIRQVANDARQNKPSIKVRPVDSGADIHTAEVYDGLIRHIESSSDADVAYDTAINSAIVRGMGFFQIGIDYACDDSFDLEIKFDRILNPRSVLFDPLTQAPDSSDWRYAFVSDFIPTEEFQRQNPGADAVSFEGSGGLSETWFTEETVRVASYWSREEIQKTIWKLSDGQIVDEDILKNLKDELSGLGITPITSRQTKSYKVTNRLMYGGGELKKTDWPGTIIPVVPVYGDEANIEGRRIFQSLIYHGKDAQRSFNFWRSAGAELIALAPKVPYLISDQAFPTDPKEAEKWGSANTQSHAYLKYRGAIAPQRTDFAGVPAGVLQEANLAAEDMRTIIGITNPGLGVPDPRETSGRALRQRRLESDTETYHFHDNLNRSVRCAGRILVEIIPKVYSGERVVRILGNDGKNSMVPVNQPITGQDGQPMTRPDGSLFKFSLDTGKYDVVVEAGPSYSTKREEAAEMLTSAISAAPETAPILLPQLVKMMDMPDGEKVTRMLATTMPPDARAIFDGTPPPPPQPPPEVQQAQAKAQADIAINQQKAQQDFQLEQQKAQNQVQVEQIQAAADIQVMRDKAAVEMQLARERAALEMELARDKAKLDAEIRAATAIHTVANKSQNGAAKNV